LDSVIVDSIDPYFSYGSPDDVVLAKNWARPFSGLGQTSVFRFKIGSHPYILNDFMKNPQAIADRFGFEQHYVTRSVKGGVKFWPGKWTRHFRMHCLPVFPLRYLMSSRIPNGSRIITFPGGPNPDDILARRWGKKFPLAASGLTHIISALRSKNPEMSLMTQLKRYFLPIPWLERYWKE
jgi:hypothetical protein